MCLSLRRLITAGFVDLSSGNSEASDNCAVAADEKQNDIETSNIDAKTGRDFIEVHVNDAPLREQSCLRLLGFGRLLFR